MGKKKKRGYATNETRHDILAAKREALRNLKNIDKPRRVLHPTFDMWEDGHECPRCFTTISKGDRVRYNDEGLVVHVSHKQKEVKYDICDRCWLAKPCDCES